MRVIVVLPTELVESVDEIARRSGEPRDALVAAAVTEFIDRHRRRDLTARMDAVYATRPGSVGQGLRAAQRRAID